MFELENKVKQYKIPRFLKRTIIILGVIGPGLITANIDNDAGGIATYSLVGARTGMRYLWTLVPITIALMMVQEMSARMGIVSGKGLADLIREKFGLKITFYMLFFLIFADLGNTMAEFAGIAAAGEIFGFSKYVTVPVSAFLVWFLILKGNYKIIEKVFLFGCLIYLSYIISGVLMKPDWGIVFKSIFIPDFTSIKTEDMPLLVGLVGTSITPWMQFYIQSAVVEKGITTKHFFESRVDIICGCLLMVTVTIFIILCCAMSLHGTGIVITGAKDAAQALRPLAGDYAAALFGIGLFNASIFAAALLPLATSYYVCEGLGWESGVDKNFEDAPHFFTIFTSLIFLGALPILIPEINLFSVLIWSQIANGILIPIIIIYIIRLCNDKEVMGKYTNTPVYNFISYGIVLLMVVINVALIYYEGIKKIFF